MPSSSSEVSVNPILKELVIFTSSLTTVISADVKETAEIVSLNVSSNEPSSISKIAPIISGPIVSPVNSLTRKNALS